MLSYIALLWIGWTIWLASTYLLPQLKLDISLQPVTLQLQIVALILIAIISLFPGTSMTRYASGGLLVLLTTYIIYISYLGLWSYLIAGFILLGISYIIYNSYQSAGSFLMLLIVATIVAVLAGVMVGPLLMVLALLKVFAEDYY